MPREGELAELARRRELALQMSGAEQVARQHEHGKLTARERISLLAAFTPRGEVTGFVTVDGRKAVVAAGDFTVRGGAATRGSGGGLGQELSELEAELDALASPFRTAEATAQDILDPAQTRELLVDFVHDAQRVLATQAGVPGMPYRP